MLKLAFALALIAGCLVVSLDNKVAAKSETAIYQSTDDSRPLPSNGLQSSVSASSSDTCSLAEMQYTLEVAAQDSCGTMFIEFMLYSNQNVNLYVRFGQRVTIEEGQIIADYKAESQTPFKSILLIPPYRGGTYYVAVSNCGTEPADFTLRFAIAVADYFGPVIRQVAIKGKKLLVSGCFFDPNAVVLLNGEEHHARYSISHEMPTLICKKAGKKIVPGETVFIQIKDSNGRLSEPYAFTRPEE